MNQVTGKQSVCKSPLRCMYPGIWSDLSDQLRLQIQVLPPSSGSLSGTTDWLGLELGQERGSQHPGTGPARPPRARCWVTAGGTRAPQGSPHGPAPRNPRPQPEPAPAAPRTLHHPVHLVVDRSERGGHGEAGAGRALVTRAPLGRTGGPQRSWPRAGGTEHRASGQACWGCSLSQGLDRQRQTQR